MPIAVAAGLFVVAAVLAVRELRKVAYSADALSVGLDESVTLVLALVVKPWFRFSFRLVGGDISVQLFGDAVGCSPVSVATSSSAPDAVFTVTGLRRGKATLTVTGSSVWGRHDQLSVGITVT